jgi:thymidylate synthase (FAD)
MHFNVLDAGTLDLVTSWGSDESIIEAARMSTGKGFRGWGPFHEDRCNVNRPGVFDTKIGAMCDCLPASGDEKLLRYLWEHQHHTPFEMCGFTVEVQAPIFVFREWHRHRTQSYNELSARYTPIPDVNYVPTVERCMMNAGTNKQAQGTGVTLTQEKAEQWIDLLALHYEEAEELYQAALAQGIPKELARLCIPVGRYSRMRASGNLRNWLAFYKLRSATNAQFEIREYADCIGKVIAEKFPRVWELAAEKP